MTEHTVDPEDSVPHRDSGEIDVWFTEWQVTEEAMDVHLDKQVQWETVPLRQSWVERLFAARRIIPMHLDTYAGAVPDGPAYTTITGRVTRIDQVSARNHPSTNPAHGSGLVPEPGGAVQHSVSSFRQPRAHHGMVVGWVVRVRT